jgi:hypothetical protein
MLPLTLLTLMAQRSGAVTAHDAFVKTGNNINNDASRQLNVKNDPQNTSAFIRFILNSLPSTVTGSAIGHNCAALHHDH